MPFSILLNKLAWLGVYYLTGMFTQGGEGVGGKAIGVRGVSSTVMLPDVPFLRSCHWDQARTSPSPVNSRRESSVPSGQRWEGNFTSLVQLTQ